MSMAELIVDDAPPQTTRKVAPGWMITFADLLSLLLAFFVMMFATTSIDRQSWQKNVLPLARYFSGKPPSANETASVPPAPALALQNADYVAALLEHLTDAADSFKGATIHRRDGDVILRLPDSNPAPATLSDLARVLGGLDNRLELRVVFDPNGAQNADAQWRDAMNAATAIAAGLGKLVGDRPIAALAAVDPSLHATGSVTEIVVHDDAGEAGHAAP